MPCDYRLYPDNWFSEIRPRILKRAGEERYSNYDLKTPAKCEWPGCEARNGELSPITGSRVVITIAHVDHDIENCEDENLAAWCQYHHLRHDVMQHSEARKKTRDRYQGKLFDEEAGG